jgi:hypothetical protein
LKTFVEERMVERYFKEIIPVIEPPKFEYHGHPTTSPSLKAALSMINPT